MRGSKRSRPRTRRVLELGGAVVLAGLFAAVAPARTLRVNISAPPEAIEGQQITIIASVSGQAKSCTLTVRYKGGRVKTSTHPANKLTWTFRVPAVPPGLATVRVKCGTAGVATRKMDVKWALQPTKISIGKTGFSQRPHNYNKASDVSYAVTVHNESVRFDATQVSVLVNFVASDNRVLGTAHKFLSRLPSNSTFYVGGQQGIPEQTAVSRLEVVVSSTPDYKQPALPPLVSDIEIKPNTETPQYVDSLHGQLLNHYTLPFRSADIGIAILDRSGRIIGGGSAFGEGPVKPNARELFEASGPFTAILASSAASALISVVPSYITPP